MYFFSEIFPNWARDTALSLTTFMNWVCNSIISQVAALVLFVFSILNNIALIF